MLRGRRALSWLLALRISGVLEHPGLKLAKTECYDSVWGGTLVAIAIGTENLRYHRPGNFFDVEKVMTGRCCEE